VTGPRVLVVTAVAAERDAVLVGAGAAGGGIVVAGIRAVAGGVGPAAGVAAAAELAGAKAAGSGFDAVVCTGVAGGFAGRAEIGELVVADRVVAADLGAFDADGSFLSLDDLGLGPSALAPDPALSDRLAATLREVGAPVRRGTVLTVATVTGTAERADELAGRWAPGAEAMEGHPVALAAARFGVPFAEVRAVSNGVGTRNRSAWDLPAALLALETVGAALLVLRHS
jgi:futalosine hydrolase